MLLFILLCAFALVQCIYYLFIFTGVFKIPVALSNSNQPVSVIICARNNLDGLSHNLPIILNQKYPKFEVIVVNDGSTDGTNDYLDAMDASESRLRVLHLDIDERYHRGKKFAQTIGIKAAKHDLLVFTDTDCTPASENWLMQMAAHFNDGKEIVLGVSNYARSASPMNWLIQLETFHTALLYVNAALNDKAYMGVGRNLAYKRDLFFSVKGFAKHQHLLSGDDDLFVNETANRTNVAICLDHSAHTISKHSGGIGDWLRQKKRHFSTGKMYRAKDKLFLGAYMVSLFMFYAAFITSLFYPAWLIPALAVFVFRFLIQGVVLHRNMRVLNYLPYYLLYPLMDLGILFIHLFIGIRGYYSKPKVW